MMSPEDEAFNDIERKAKQRMEAVRAAMLREEDDDIQDYKKAWVELTDKEIKALAKPSDDIAIPMTGRMWIFVGDLMNKLKEKNT
jgi:hypothetical protein